MKVAYLLAALVVSCAGFAADDHKPESASPAVIRAFQTHDIVMLGEIHGNKQEYEWLRSLVSTPEFADRVDDIVVEFGNSLYQQSVDRYVSGEDVPVQQVQKAWRNLIGAIGPPSPVYGWLYQAVRETNVKRHGKHQMRIVCGDPYIDWDKVKDREDIGPYLANRDEWYTEVVKQEVLAKHYRALLIMGAGHFLRRDGPGRIERNLKQVGANTFLIVFGTNTVGPGEVDHRFDSWPTPAVISLSDSWVGELPALPVTSGGGMANVRFGPPSAGGTPATPASAPLKLKDAADALLYLGPRDSLTKVFMPRAELEGTPYGKEIARRLTIQLGQVPNFLHDKQEAPQFENQQSQMSAANTAPPPLPPPPKSIHDPLPPRPPSQ
jgi:hypothetical protein